MKDFSVITAQVLLKITSVSPIRGFLPPSVIILGEKLNLTKEVVYNGLNAPEFIIASPTRLIARIPDSQVGKELTNLQAVSTVAVSRNPANVLFEISRPLATVSGIDRMVQAWLLIFRTNPGSDVFSPQSGGGADAIIGRSTDRLSKSAAADLALSIERTNTELKQLQAKNRNIPLDEKLLSGDLDSINFDEATTVLSARVSLRNMIGDRAQVSFR